MTLFFIRHGEKEITSIVNPLIGHTDPPLTSNGIRQSELLVEYFKNIEIDYIYASEYLRAQQTAQPLAGDRNIGVQIDKRLNEIDNGIIETMADREIEKEYPDFWREFFEHTHDVRFPGGETGEEVQKRQKSILEEIKRRSGTYVLFCHEGYIRILMCTILGMPVYHRYRFKYDYCGITEVVQDNGEWKIKRFNDIPYRRSD